MRSRPFPRALLPWMLTVLLTTSLTACGERDDGSSTGGGGTAGDGVPTTPQALAWVTADRLGEPDAAGPTSELRDLGPKTVATSVRYGRHALSVGVSPDRPSGYLVCDAGFFDDCADLGGGATLGWQEEEPEEDPGVVYLFVEKDGGATVVLEQSSTPITADPREVDLPFSVDAMLDLARDPRVDLTTTQDAVDEGAAAPWWRGGS